jgi:hypothetical protein
MQTNFSRVLVVGIPFMPCPYLTKNPLILHISGYR